MHHNDIIAECLSHEAHNHEGVAGCPPLSMPHVYIFIYLFIYMSGSMAVSDSVRSSWKHTPWTATRIMQSASQILSSILLVLVIESHWTDKAHNHGPARCSHSSNWSRGEAPGLSDYTWWIGGVCYLFTMSGMLCVVYTLQYQVVTLL